MRLWRLVSLSNYNMNRLEAGVKTLRVAARETDRHDYSCCC
jgi:hypothetical protein